MKTYKTDLLDLRCCDCMELMLDMPDNSVDSIVTDPPYGLGKEPDPVEVMRGWCESGYHEVKGKGFMGKDWDAFVPQPVMWKEAFRVLKPGGHLLCFAGTRTVDWMAMSIRFAGFEIRDQIYWHYGSGFPKSLNVSKMLDKMAGAERGTEYKPNFKNGTFGKGMGGGKHGAHSDPPATEAARQWDGWGTALKPATEPIVMARKPLAKGNTVAANVQEYGTGAINIDATRVSGEGYSSGGKNNSIAFGSSLGKQERCDGSQGRWPANLIHDGSEEVVELFPVTKSGSRKAGDYGVAGSDEVYGKRGISAMPELNGDSGSAARFFYCAKASKADRDEGCEGLEARLRKTHGDTGPSDNAKPNGQTAVLSRNHHPTVKPTDLMRYLCRLVTPPGGVVLDPFMGSGSTGKAAVLEGFRFVGSEMQQEYFEIAKTRIDAAIARVKRETAQQELAL